MRRPRRHRLRRFDRCRLNRGSKSATLAMDCAFAPEQWIGNRVYSAGCAGIVPATVVRVSSAAIHRQQIETASRRPPTRSTYARHQPALPAPVVAPRCASRLPMFAGSRTLRRAQRRRPDAFVIATPVRQIGPSHPTSAPMRSAQTSRSLQHPAGNTTTAGLALEDCVARAA